MGYILDKYQRSRPQFTKDYLLRTYKGYMYDRTLSIFKYYNLPSTIPEEMFEYYLQHFGSCVITEVNGELYALHGNYGGYIDPYYRPTKYIVANPALKFSAELAIEQDCIFCTNDKLWIGLDPLISRYAYLIAENLITLRVANVMLRIVALLSAPDDKTKAEAQIYLKNLEEGKLGIIGENRFFDGVRMQSPPSNNGSYLTQFIELHQYLLGTFYSEIGLKANFNMKREAIMAEESSLNDDVIIALVETMYQCRLSNVERINSKYDTSIQVSYGGEWLRNEIERNIELISVSSQAGVPLDGVVSQLSSEEKSSDGADEGRLDSVSGLNGSGDERNDEREKTRNDEKDDERNDGRDDDSNRDDVSGSGSTGDNGDISVDEKDREDRTEKEEERNDEREDGREDEREGTKKINEQDMTKDVVSFNTNKDTNEMLVEMIKSAEEEREKEEKKEEEKEEREDEEGGDINDGIDEKASEN